MGKVLFHLWNIIATDQWIGLEGRPVKRWPSLWPTLVSFGRRPRQSASLQTQHALHSVCVLIFSSPLFVQCELISSTRESWSISIEIFFLVFFEQTTSLLFLWRQAQFYSALLTGFVLCFDQQNGKYCHVPEAFEENNFLLLLLEWLKFLFVQTCVESVQFCFFEELENGRVSSKGEWLVVVFLPTRPIFNMCFVWSKHNIS